MASPKKLFARAIGDAKDVLTATLSPTSVLGPFSRRSGSSDDEAERRTEESQETHPMASSSKKTSEQKAAPAKKAAAKKAAAKKAAPDKATSTKKAAATTAPAKKTPAKKAAAKAAPAKKATAKAAPAKNAPAKASAKKATAKKTASAKAAPAKKAPAKKAPAKAAATEKVASKAVAAKATSAKKTPAKKPAASKPAAAAPAATASGTAATASPTTRLGKASAPSQDERPTEQLVFGSPGYPFDQKFLDGQVELLNEERRTLVAQAEALKSEADALARDREPGDVQFDDESGEGDTLAVERDMDLARAARAMQTVDEIDAALLRIEKGVYGICEYSGLPIPAERLEVIPYARERVEYKTRSFR